LAEPVPCFLGLFFFVCVCVSVCVSLRSLDSTFPPYIFLSLMMAAPIVFSFITRQLAMLPAKRPLIVGINGAQGIGKTTLVNKLTDTLKENQLTAVRGILLHEPPPTHCWIHYVPPFYQVFLSIDDLYLPFAEQSKLAETYPENPLLKFRGNAGTHSVELGIKTLADLSLAQKNYEAGLGNGEGWANCKVAL